MIRQFVRRWLGITVHHQAIEGIILQLNENTHALDRLVVYEREVPALARALRSMKEGAMRRRRKAEAEPPTDAVADDVSEQVVG